MTTPEEIEKIKQEGDPGSNEDPVYDRVGKHGSYPGPAKTGDRVPNDAPKDKGWKERPKEKPARAPKPSATDDKKGSTSREAKAERARNPDGTFVADDPATPDVDEAFVEPSGGPEASDRDTSD